MLSMLHRVLRVGMLQGLYGWLVSRHLRNLRGEEEKEALGELLGWDMGVLE